MLSNNLKIVTVQDDHAYKATVQLALLCAFSGCTEVFLGTESGSWKLKTCLHVSM